MLKKLLMSASVMAFAATNAFGLGLAPAHVNMNPGVGTPAGIAGDARRARNSLVTGQ